MQTRDVVGFCLIPLSLLIAAGSLSVSTIGSISWFAALIGTAVLVLGLVSLSQGVKPAQIPFPSLRLIFLASLLIGVFGLVIRLYYSEELLNQRLASFIQGQMGTKTNPEFLSVTVIFEWFSFLGVLFCVFLVARQSPELTNKTESV